MWRREPGMRKGSEGEGRRDTSMLHVVALSILPVKKGSREKKGKEKKGKESCSCAGSCAKGFCQFSNRKATSSWSVWSFEIHFLIKINQILELRISSVLGTVRSRR